MKKSEGEEKKKKNKTMKREREEEEREANVFRRLSPNTHQMSSIYFTCKLTVNKVTRETRGGEGGIEYKNNYSSEEEDYVLPIFVSFN